MLCITFQSDSGTPENCAHGILRVGKKALEGTVISLVASKMTGSQIPRPRIKGYIEVGFLFLFFQTFVTQNSSTILI